MDNITLIAETTFRNARRKFGIKVDDRRRHVYTVGKTGMGKTAMLENMAIQDIQNGNGIGFVDPHGDAAERILYFVPSSRINDVVYINPADLNFPIAFNIMEQVDIEHRNLVAGGLMGVFKKIWPDVWSARMEYILNNCILALLEYPGATLLGVNRMLSDVEYRKKVVDKITDPVVKAFWVQEYARYTQRYEVEATAAIQNKVGQFISSPLIRNIIGQTTSSIDMRKIMDEKKILIMNLSKGRVGEDSSRLLGALLITKIQLAAMSRVDIPEEKRNDFYLYVDEFQNFATQSFISVLSEARKYRLALILGHQYITQMEEEVRDAVFGNVGTLISFRVGAEDAEWLEKEFTPEFLATDIVNLAKYNIYLKLMIDGLAGRPFSAQTMPPLPLPKESFIDKIIKASRDRYTIPRQIVEENISLWTGDLSTASINSAPTQGAGPVLYDARCSMCGKDTKVVFQPDGKRPVYCKPCRKKLMDKQQPPAEQAVPSGGGTPPEERRPENSGREDNSPPLAFVPFSSPRRSSQEAPIDRPKRKEINLGELKQAIEDSLDKKTPVEKPQNDNKDKSGTIEPGQTVQL
ncbi:MAG: CxxC-x17-CxxC domain-containing protein [Candidatus Nealsonbacteria bacterium]